MDWRSPRVRILLVSVLALVWMGAALARLSYLQLFQYGDYLARAQRQQQRIVEVSPRRGILYDRNLRELAMSVQVDSSFAVPVEIADPPMAARLLGGVLGTSPEEIETRLSSSRSFVWVARKLSPEKVERIQALNLRGVYFQKENQRFYPHRELAAHVLGYVDIDEKGLGGVEYALDKQIRGKPGRMLVLADARRRWFDRSEHAAGSGANVVLTLDQNIQYIAEKELAEAARQSRALAGTIVVQDPLTGELLAVANWPPFNPNAPADSGPESRMNRAIGALYEPGSTFKVVTLAAALEEGITRPEEVIDCQMGAIYIAGHRIRDHKPFGLLTVSQVMSESSDVGAIKLGLRLGAPKLFQYMRAFGFGSPTGVDLPGENRGLLRRVENWTPISVGSISMGQEIGVTPVQLTSAVSAIANGGLLVRPRAVREIRRGLEVIPVPAPEPHRVISPQTAATLRSMLEGVVLQGTGMLARLDGYTAAGKTGTAQKIDPATGRYSPTQHIASFVGFAPINSPAVTILISLDSPVGRYHGGEVAAPVFKRVAEQVLSYLNVPHDVPISPRLQEAALRSKKNNPIADVSDFTPAQLEQADDAVAEASQPAQPWLPRSAPTVALAPARPGLAEGEGIPVPSFSGKSVRQVTEECLRLGLNPVLVGTGVATEQSPAAGELFRRGGRVMVRFARRASLVGTSVRGN
ncbi:MAG TPA: penicillin-binding protein [Candidatus Acidoferrales bacterium]|nr:penicillin-binding protein [Candidatus Acidoferrales bacterium]